MIRVPGQNRQRAINLLGGHDAHELVRPGHGAEGDDAVGASPKVRVEPVRPADYEESRRHAGIAVAAERLGESLARRRLAALVEKPELAPGR